MSDVTEITLEQLEAAETLAKAYRTLERLQIEASGRSFDQQLTDAERRQAARTDGAFYTARGTLFDAMNCTHTAGHPVAQWFMDEILGRNKVSTVATDKTDSTEGGE